MSATFWYQLGCRAATKQAAEKTALSAFGVGNLVRKTLPRMAAGTWKPSAVAVRKGLTGPADRLNAFEAKTMGWVDGQLGAARGPANFRGQPRRGALDRVLETAEAQHATTPLPPTWLTAGPSGSMTPEVTDQLSQAFRLGRPFRSKIAPGEPGEALAHPPGDTYVGQISGSPSTAVLLHELGHLADPSLRTRMPRTPREFYASELRANRGASQALPRLPRVQGQPVLGPRRYHQTLRPSLETYRLDMLRDASSNLSSNHFVRHGGNGAGPWPRPLTFANPFPAKSPFLEFQGG